MKKGRGCWLWLGSKNGDGYGTCFYQGKCHGTHRIAWHLTHGEWPAEQVLHRCDVRGCVNPAHLFQGDHAANMADMTAKVRGCNRLTEEQARAALARARKGGESYRAIGRSYGVRAETIYHLAKRKTWKWL